MDTWEDFLHWQFKGSHVLFPAIRLNSFWSLFVGSMLAIVICLFERLITFALDKHWCPSFIGHSPFKNALWRSGLYWMATFLRLAYMLISMSFHAGLLLVIVTTLATAQFFIELHKYPQTRTRSAMSYSTVEDSPLLSDSASQSMSMLPVSRPRSKSKPDDIFIHPNQSNIARADAVAMELGLGGPTDRVSGNNYPQSGSSWETGKGREAAKALLGSARNDPHFSVGDGSESESDM
ncbi:copper transporter [Dendrothele bispora CBS 962.96]|uniref:Copper transporter n=1 Tax=Dendrothele bispora (strain CBS 962.96) TaxID=1314807 RepID=A0A4S8MG48_DENBC|nr:copper transporter [Dendrothele bispora CBS 962.96]